MGQPSRGDETPQNTGSDHGVPVLIRKEIVKAAVRGKSNITKVGLAPTGVDKYSYWLFQLHKPYSVAKYNMRERDANLRALTSITQAQIQQARISWPNVALRYSSR